MLEAFQDRSADCSVSQRSRCHAEPRRLTKQVIRGLSAGALTG